MVRDLEVMLLDREGVLLDLEVKLLDREGVLLDLEVKLLDREGVRLDLEDMLLLAFCALLMFFFAAVFCLVVAILFSS
jgi:hypothetical protein